jgi:hypothetical protein
VALYAPATVQRHRFCVCSSLAIKLAFVVSVPTRENQIGALYVIVVYITIV